MLFCSFEHKWGCGRSDEQEICFTPQEDEKTLQCGEMFHWMCATELLTFYDFNLGYHIKTLYNLVVNVLHLKCHNPTSLVNANAKSRGLYDVCLFHRTLTLPTSAAAGMMDWPSALSFTHICLLIFLIKSSTVRTRQVHYWVLHHDYAQ